MKQQLLQVVIVLIFWTGMVLGMTIESPNDQRIDAFEGKNKDFEGKIKDFEGKNKDFKKDDSNYTLTSDDAASTAVTFLIGQFKSELGSISKIAVGTLVLAVFTLFIHLGGIIIRCCTSIGNKRKNPKDVGVMCSCGRMLYRNHLFGGPEGKVDLEPMVAKTKQCLQNTKGCCQGCTSGCQEITTEAKESMAAKYEELKDRLRSRMEAGLEPMIEDILKTKFDIVNEN